jgi:hypothetical protein
MMLRGGQITGTQVIELPITNYWNKCNSITNYKLHLKFLSNYKLQITQFQLHQITNYITILEQIFRNHDHGVLHQS